MKTLKESIKGSMKGFFKNVGTDLGKAKEWIDNVPVYFDLYGMQYNKKAVERDRDRFTIKFLSAYKRRTKERDIVLNLSPFITKLQEYDPNQCAITFGWGWGENAHQRYGQEVKVSHPNSKELFDEWDGKYYIKEDKIIKLTVSYYEKPNPKPNPQNIITGSELRRMGEHNAKHLLVFGVYLNDYPFTEDSWTLFKNNL